MLPVAAIGLSPKQSGKIVAWPFARQFHIGDSHPFGAEQRMGRDGIPGTTHM